MSGASPPSRRGRWFHGGRAPTPPGSSDPALAAARQGEALARLVQDQQAEAEVLRLQIGELRRELLDLARARALLAAEAAVAACTGSRRAGSAEAFWSAAPVLGFRAWRLTASGARGVAQVWEGPRLDAVCVAGPGAPHDAPCHCGIYAFKRARALAPCLLRIAPWSVHGLVALSGRVVEHERGYRAQRAEVRAVAVVGGGHAVCRSDPGFIAQLFAPRMGLSLGRATADAGDDADPVEYLEDQARRFGELWTSESRSG